jgi:HTH-type transcriptional repressor of NAD biosynthesis genes
VTTRGFLLGKFMPLHAGHIALCRTAMALVDELSVMVCTRDSEPVPGALRAAWMHAMVPGARLLHHYGEIPQEPEDHPDFWPIWRRMIRAIHPEPITHVFGSELYITRLAEELGAQPVPVDPDRRAFPVSGEAVRADPAGQWRFLPPPVRPWYQKRVVVFGAESTGKSTMADRLAAAATDDDGGPVVPEYGRAHERVRNGAEWNAPELIELARRHEAHRAAIAPWGGPVLIEDTDPLLTAVWAQMLLGERVPELEARPMADLYLLLDADVPFVQDGIRYFADGGGRRRFQALCEEMLERIGARFERVTGDWDERDRQAQAAVERLRAEPFPGRWTLPLTLHPVLAGEP